MDLYYKYAVDYIFTHRKGSVSKLEELIGEYFNILVKNKFIIIDDDVWKITFMGKEEFYRNFPNVDIRKWYIKFPRKFLFMIAKTLI